jgi:hypothetical protein
MRKDERLASPLRGICRALFKFEMVYANANLKLLNICAKIFGNVRRSIRAAYNILQTQEVL